MKRKIKAGCSGTPRAVRRWTLLICSVILIAFSVGTCRALPVTKLSLWTHQRHIANLVRQLVTEFNNTVGRKKGISVSVRVIGDDMLNVFQEAQQNGAGPDLYSGGFITGYEDPIKAGAQICFDDLPGFKEWKASWPSWYWIEGLTTYKGKVFAIPIQVFNSRLIYNRDLFRKVGLNPDRPPRSYQELQEVAKVISQRSKGQAYGFAYCGGEAWPMEWMPSQWAEANGEAAYWDWRTGRWALRGYQKVWQLILDLEQAGSMFPGTALLTNDALRAQFAEGRVGMFMGEFWDVGVLTDQFPAKCDWGVGPVPTFDGKFHGKPRAMMIAGYWNINGQSRYKEEAWEVVKWFCRYEVRARFYEQGKGIDPDPAVKKYIKASSPLPQFKAFAAYLDQDYLATYPILPGWKAPKTTPSMLLREILISKKSDLGTRLTALETLWNRQLTQYYKDNPDVKVEWNIYPNFDRQKGLLGPPLVRPIF